MASAPAMKRRGNSLTNNVWFITGAGRGQRSGRIISISSSAGLQRFHPSLKAEPRLNQWLNRTLRSIVPKNPISDLGDWIERFEIRDVVWSP